MQFSHTDYCISYAIPYNLKYKWDPILSAYLFISTYKLMAQNTLKCKCTKHLLLIAQNA